RGTVPLIALSQDQPVALLPVEMGGDERPDTFQPLARKPYRQPAVALLLEELVRAVVPDLDSPGTVLPSRDLAGERRVVERVILDVDRERLLADLERDPLRHGPGSERAATLEPEVVMEASRGVLLHDEDRRATGSASAKGLRGLRGVAFASVGAEFRHCSVPASSHILNTRLKTLWMVWRTGE